MYGTLFAEGLFMTGIHLTEIPVVFYRTSSGVEPVREWLRNLPEDDRRSIGVDLSTVQVGWPIGMPLCRPFGGGLWELRSSLPSHRIARVLFFVHEGRIGIVHGFIKKTEKTPQDELELARKRMEEMTT
jgi:phage-related protein